MDGFDLATIIKIIASSHLSESAYKTDNRINLHPHGHLQTIAILSFEYVHFALRSLPHPRIISFSRLPATFTSAIPPAEA